MAGQQISQAIWTDEAVVESMHRLKAALTQWEEVGAAEEVDLDEMKETEQQFLEALARLNGELRQEESHNASSDGKHQPAQLTAEYKKAIQIPDSDLVNAISHLVDTGEALTEESYQFPRMTRAVTGLIHALRQVDMVQ